MAVSVREGGTARKVCSPLLRGTWQRRVGMQRKVGTMDKVKTSGRSDGASFISLNSHLVPPLPHLFKRLLVDPKTEPKGGDFEHSVCLEEQEGEQQLSCHSV